MRETNGNFDSCNSCKRLGLGASPRIFEWGGGSNRRQGSQPTPKYPKNREKYRILATSFSNLGGGGGGVDHPGFQKCRGQDPPPPPTPPSATPLVARAVYMSYMSQNFRLFIASNLSVLNFIIFLLMYPGSLSGTSAKARR